MRTWIFVGALLLGLGAAGLILLPVPGSTPPTPDLANQPGSLLEYLRHGNTVVVLSALAVLLAGSLVAWWRAGPPTRGTTPLTGGLGSTAGLGGLAIWMLAALLVTVWPTRILLDQARSLYPVLYGNSLALQLVLLVGCFLLLPLVPLSLRGWIPGSTPPKKALVTGLQGYLRVVPLVLIAQVLNRRLLAWVDVPEQMPYSLVFFHTARTPIQLVALVLLVAGLAPLAEEFFFRGLLYRNLRGVLPVRAAALFSALVFASVHFNVQQFLPLLVLGYFLATWYETSDSLITPIAMHTLQNASSLLILYLIYGPWSGV